MADRAEPRADRVGDGVGLLGGEAAVLDREGGRVAGRVDVAGADHAQVLVDGQVPLVVVREPGDARADQLGQRDGEVGVDQRAALEPDGAVEGAHGGGAGDQIDAGAVELGAHRLARGRAERLERRVLGRGDDDVGLGDAAVAQRGGAQQRQLVEREQPARARRGDEGEPQPRVREHARDRLLDEAGAHRAAERGGAGHHLARARAGGDHEDLVGNRVAVAREHAVALGLDRRQAVAMQAHAEPLGQVVERDARRRPAAERRRNRRRAVDELGRGSEQLEVRARARDGAQREDAFDRSHPGAGDEDPCHAARLPRPGRPVIRCSPQTRAENPQRHPRVVPMRT